MRTSASDPILIILVVGAMVGLLSPPVLQGQPSQDPSEQRQRPDCPKRIRDANLPSWAETQSPSQGQSPSSLSQQPSTDADPPPRDEVPVGGHLIWLLLAGVGYGTFELSKDGDLE